MEKVNLGIIGLGFIGKVHLRNSIKLKSAKVLAVADVSRRALDYARNFGVKHLFTDYHSLLKFRDVDAVIISLPTHLHAECAISAMEEGKHVFLEKPLARNPEEGEKIVSTANKNGVKLIVGYPLRFVPEFKKLKEEIESGVLGDVQIAHAVNIGAGPFFHRAESTIPKPVPEWWLNKDLTGGGVLTDLGSHMINLTRWYFGEVKEIKACLGYRFNLDVEDHAICIADFNSGVKAVINVGWFSQKAAIGIELYGTISHFSFFEHPQNKVMTAINLIFGKLPKFFKPYFAELKQFVDCIKNDEGVPIPSGYDALEDLKVIAKAYRNQLLDAALS
ncbi:MAG: Gfo/Idh/MocA family oxidoreductase [Candidatus Bathyarchaeia archaeon]